MRLEDWPSLSKAARINYMLRTFKTSKNSFNWYEGFELYIQRPGFMHLLNEFVRFTYEDYSSSRHGAAKRCWELMREIVDVNDGSVLFKLNNSYTSSVAALVSFMFSEQLIDRVEFFKFRPSLREMAAA